MASLITSITRLLLPEQIGMRASAHEHNQAMLCAVIEFVGQQKIASDMALPMPFPFAAQRVVEPFRPERAIVGDQQQHRFLEPVHVVSARPR